MLSALDGVAHDIQTRGQRLDATIERVLTIPTDEAALRTARGESVGGQPASREGFRSAGGRQTTMKRPLAHTRSPRDNQAYRAAFISRNHRPPGDPPVTTASDLQIVPHRTVSLPALRAADQGVADALESVISKNTRRVYETQWRLFESWCGEVGLTSLPAEPLTVARYLAARAGSGASIATLRLAASAIAKAHEWAGRESPCQDRGVHASLKGWGRRLGKPQRQAGALTADVLAVIRLTAGQPRKRGRGVETAEQGRRTRPFRPGPGGGALRRRVAAFRGRRSHLGRRPALG